MNEWLNRALAAAGEAVAESFAQDIPNADCADSVDSPANCTNCTNSTSGAKGEGVWRRVNARTSDLAASGGWDAETAALIEWFLKTTPPAAPFELQRAVCIARPGRYWEYLREDIKAGPNHARGKTGALQDDLRRLHQLFGRDQDHAA